jgi:hypothetical protein
LCKKAGTGTKLEFFIKFYPVYSYKVSHNPN